MRSLLVSFFALAIGCSSADDGGAATTNDADQSDTSTADETSTPDSGADDGGTSDTGTASDTGTTSDAPADTTDPGPPSVRLVGRFTDKNEFQWSGSHLIARFNGTGAHLKLNAGSLEQFQVIVDGKPTMVLKPTGGSKTYDVATGLPSGIHELVVWRRTEAFEGVSTYEGLTIDGTLLSPTPPSGRRIEIVGDSITCGYGDEGVGPSCSFTADTENQSITYGALAAKSLNADLVTACWSGIGMYRNYGGETTNVMPTYYPRTLPETDTSTWDFSKYVPQAVVINLGTNDFAKGDPGKPYQDAYLAFVKMVRSKYPSAYILAVIPVAGAKTYIDGVVASMKSGGDTNMGTFTPSAIAGSDGWGCDYHPSAATHAKWGTELAAALKAKLGW